MSKSWIVLIVVAVITMVVIIGFEFYNSISGANAEFRKTVVNLELSSDLGTQVLDFMTILQGGMLVQDDELDATGSITPTPTSDPLFDPFVPTP